MRGGVDQFHLSVSRITTLSIDESHEDEGYGISVVPREIAKDSKAISLSPVAID
jgi:hypothetical protein